MEEIYKMAGHTAAHAIWSISDGDTLMPILGVIDTNNESSMIRLEVSEVEKAIEYGKKYHEKNQKNSKGAAFVCDGYVELEEGKIDSLIVRVEGFDAFKSNLSIALPYRPCSDEKGFAVYRPKIMDNPQEYPERLQDYMNAFFDGLEGHEQGSEIWNTKYVDQIETETDINDNADYGLREDQWKLLCLSPYLIFLTIAAANGEIDNEEVESFANIISKAYEQPSTILQQILVESCLSGWPV
jgi:hypothetical protein